MSKDSFNWKSLFVNDENDKDKQDESQKQAVTHKEFPKASENYVAPTSAQQTTFPSSSSSQVKPTSGNNPFIEEIVEVYERGFNSLNLENFDFFEMYKSVMAVGVSNPQSYTMAFAMGKSIKSDLTKEFLLDKSKFYLAEIEKVYDKFNTAGNAKKYDLDIALTRDKANLSKEVSDLEDKIQELQKEHAAKKQMLIEMDAGSTNLYSEIQQKIEANSFAKQKLTESIQQVVAGINQYL